MNLKHILLFLVAAFCSIIELNAATILSNQKQSVNDGWSFLSQDVGSVWEVLRPAPKGQPESVPLWSKVSLPHCFNEYDAVSPFQNYYQGVGWYRSDVKFKKIDKNEKVIIEVEGSGQKTDLYIDNQHVANHIGGYDGWYVDITDQIMKVPSKESYTIAFRCDNSRDAEMIPSSLSDFTIYGGLYRNVNIVYLPKRYIDKLQITPYVNGKSKKGIVKVNASFRGDNEDSNSKLSINIKDNNGNVVASAQESQTILSVNNIKKWSPDNPYLYRCEVEWEWNGIKQRFTEYFGFKEIKFEENGPFYLNGNRLMLKGTHIHEDFANVGAAMTDEMIYHQVKQMKEMGVNFIRLGHYQQSELMLHLCDSLGIMVWEEIPWCRGGLGGNRYRKQTKDMLKNMINQHYNHTSVILWGLGNETDWNGDFEHTEKDSVKAFMSDLNLLSHKLDSTRRTVIRRNDYCMDVVDVYSPSIWMGWYSSTFSNYFSEVEKKTKQIKHFFHAEWGGDSHARRHSETNSDNIEVANKNGDWSETYIVRLFDWCLKEQEKMPWLTGSAFWTFRDFATPLRPENPIPYVNQKGVVERDGTLKESYFVFQSYWSKKAMAHIYGHTWPVRWGKDGEMKEVLVYSNCEKAELFVNGVSQGIKRRNSQDFPAAGLHWNVKYKNGENRLKVIAYLKGTVVTDSIVQEYQCEQWGDPEKISLSCQKSDDGTTIVCAQLLDKNNVRCLDSKEYINFEYIGDGEMIKDQGTSTGSSYIQLYNGRAYIKVKGRVNGILSAKIKKIPTAFIAIREK